MERTKKTPTYFKPTSDVGFHKLFCTEGNDQLVLQLLNAVIDDQKIVGFQRLDSVHQLNIDTTAIFDLYCECADGSRIIVECQNGSGSTNFMNRALAYSAIAILDQARAGWRYDFEKVYFIGLLNYVHWHGRPQAITKVALYTEDDHILAQQKYLQIFVELPKLQAGTDGEDPGRLFLRALRDIGKSDARPEEYVRKDLDLLFHASSYTSLDAEERARYDENMTTVEDLMDYARECSERAREEGMRKGMEKGMKKGEARGEAKKQREIARAMLSGNVDLAAITKFTGLSEQEIRNL